MRKILIPACIGLLAVLFAACGSSDAPATESTSPAVTQSTSSSGQTFKLQYACINRTLKSCELVESFYIPRVLERTNGQVDIGMSSFPELGLAGPDTLRLVENGTLEIAEIYSGYVGADLPILNVGNLYGLPSSVEAAIEVNEAVKEDMERIIRERTDGEPVLRNFFSSQYFFSKDPLVNLDDFKGKIIRQNSTIWGDMFKGLGADGQFVAFADVYSALEEGSIDAAVSCGTCGSDLRWYEQSDHLVGPVEGSIVVTYMTVNGEIWNEIPLNLQQIMLEVAEEFERENIRLLTAEWDPAGIADNVTGGMEYNDFTPDMKSTLREIAVDIILPSWVERVGGADSEGAEIYNEKVAPIVGVKINPDGTASETTAER